jgi:hypothetical protein
VGLTGRAEQAVALVACQHRAELSRHESGSSLARVCAPTRLAPT